VRSLVHPDGKRCRRCRERDDLPAKGADLFADLLRAADWKRSTALLRALLDRGVYRIFLR
ncbi:MAG TPA: hypothetical protein VMS17_17520, partial [Gemmataceae bacterium]|nr:hypothetical protein [Gemmataceae bacterium]